jgi:hypothetical protein
VPRGMDTLLGHCIARAVMQDVVREAGGFDAAKAKYGENAERWSTWSKLRAVTKATPKASRVATFIVCWAIAMQEEDRDSYSITEYMRYWNENERKAYRVQNEFRELWGSTRPLTSWRNRFSGTCAPVSPRRMFRSYR